MPCFDNDTVRFTLWKCPSCEQKAILGGYYFEDAPVLIENPTDTISFSAVPDEQNQISVESQTNIENLFPKIGEEIINESRVVGIIDTVLDGRQLKFITFQTVDFEDECFHTGRFNCAALGVAEFEKSGNQWNLSRFTPALACMGSFGDVRPIKVIRLGKNNYGYILEDMNGGPGGPFYSRMFLFA